MPRRSSLALLVLLAVLAPRRAAADLVTDFADIRFWVGSGMKESAVVVDWGDGDAPLAWGYRWDGDAVAADALRAVVGADTRLTWDTSDFGTPGSPNEFVNRVTHVRSDGTVSSFDPAVDNDDTRQDFWAYFTADESPHAADGIGPDGVEGWLNPGYGISGLLVDEDFNPVGTRLMADGEWTGLRPNPGDDFGSLPPRLANAAPAPVPEPAAALLVLLAAGGLAVRRRVLSNPHAAP